MDLFRTRPRRRCRRRRCPLTGALHVRFALPTHRHARAKRSGAAALFVLRGGGSWYSSLASRRLPYGTYCSTRRRVLVVTMAMAMMMAMVVVMVVVSRCLEGWSLAQRPSGL